MTSDPIAVHAWQASSGKPTGGGGRVRCSGVGGEDDVVRHGSVPTLVRATHMWAPQHPVARELRLAAGEAAHRAMVGPA